MDSNQRLPPCQGDTLPTELRGQKRNGSISKKSLNSKQILIFRKIPPKFYTRFRRDVKRRRILRKILRYCRSSAWNFIALARCSRALPQQPILPPPLFYLVALLHPASFHLLALPCPVIFRSLALLRLAPAKTSKFFHSALEFLRFAASRPDRFVSCSRAYHRVLAYLDRAQSYRIRGGFLYKFCFF